MKSKTGRQTRRVVRLIPIAIPSGIATSIEKIVAVITSASVVIDASQRPWFLSSNIPMAIAAANRRLTLYQDASTKVTITRREGGQRKTSLKAPLIATVRQVN